MNAFSNIPAPQFSLFQEVTVLESHGSESPCRGWVMGVEFYDSLAKAAATHSGQEPLFVRDIDLEESGNWEYVISFQFGLTQDELEAAPLIETELIPEDYLAPISQTTRELVAA